MTLIILLLVLIIERVGLNSDSWQANRYVDWYASKYGDKVKEKDNTGLLFFVLAPAVIIGVLLFILDSRLLDFIVGLLVMGVCVGHYPVRNLYRQYLNAQQRNDAEAMAIVHQQLSNKESADDTKDTIGETLIWNNFKFYAAPIFFFVVLGVPGVVFYTTLLFLTIKEAPVDKANDLTKLNEDMMEESSDAESEGSSEDNTSQHALTAHQSTLNKWLEWAHFVPARLVSIGFMFVGHFGSGLDAWLRLAGDIKKPARQIINNIAMAAEGNPVSSAQTAPENNTAQDISSADSTHSQDEAEPHINATQNNELHHNAEIMVRLAKRNMVLFLVVVALLTLYGQIV